jgi:LAO/AO transport system kinase
MNGIESSHDGIKRQKRRRFVKKHQSIPTDKLFTKINEGSRADLAKGITLIESESLEDEEAAQDLLHKALKVENDSIRLGITGVPGSGKSTFIEAFGLMLCELGHKVAVLAIDPSSSLSGGSILGDKTRMEKLSRHPNAFVRPSPSSGTLGGARKQTRETLLLCEAAGYDIIIIETVGVGQSETAVRDMVDFFLLLALTGAGDDLQGMKKGIMELTDLIVVHKADGKNLLQAEKKVREFKRILHLLQPATPGWTSRSIPVSSLENTGQDKVWEIILEFKEMLAENGYWHDRRKQQAISWFHDMIYLRLENAFFRKPGKKDKVKEIEGEILKGQMTVTKALEEVFKA